MGRERLGVSTDPVHRLSLAGLAEMLQTAESEADPQSAIANPWFDGAPLNHTLIAAPEGGSKLEDERIEEIVKLWSRASSVGEPTPKLVLPVNRRQAMVAAGAAGVLGIGWCTWGLFRNGGRGADPLLEIAESERSTPAGPRNGKDYALLVATDEYDHWGNLGNPILDASRLAEVLQKAYGFETDLIPNPTATEFLDAIAKLSERVYSPQDQLLIFVAGHGDFLPNTKEGFLVFRNSLTRGTDRNRDTYVPHSRLRNMIEMIRCDQILVVLDVCFGGTFDFGTALDDRNRGGVYQQVSKGEFIRRKLARPGRHWLTSGARELVPDGKRGQHSPFARQMLAALNNGGDAGIVTLGDIIRHVEKIQTEPRNDPLREHDGGDFLFIRRDDFVPGSPAAET